MRIRTASGRIVELVDDHTGGDRFLRHAYRGAIPGLGLDLVEIGYCEGGGFLAIDQHVWSLQHIPP